MDVYSQAEDGIRDSLIEFVIPGWCASTRPQMRNCASGNLEIPGPMLRIAPEGRQSERQCRHAPDLEAGIELLDPERDHLGAFLDAARDQHILAFIGLHAH